jgi:pimeloyl-ACP methyl ester carboxylesterase
MNMRAIHYALSSEDTCMLHFPIRNSRTVRFTACVLLLFAAATRADELKRRGRMGVQLAPLEADRAKELGIAGGMRVPGVMPGTPAEQAGVKSGDIMVAIDGQRFSDIQSGLNLLRGRRAGDTLKVELLRDGKPVNVEITLADRPKETSDEFDIIYASAGKPGQRVRTYISKPRAAGKHPAILFVQSLNPSPMEFADPRMAVHPYKQLSDRLTRAGFVTMRVDRPGNGDSEGGDPRKPKLADDLTAFNAALTALAARPEVDPAHVYVFAMSMGSALAPRLAAHDAAKGVITYAAIARPWPEHLMESMQTRWKFELIEEDEFKQRSAHAKQFLDGFFVAGQTPQAILAAHPEIADFVGQLVQDEEYMMGSHYTFFQEMGKLDLAAQWATVRVPVLVLWGGSDFVAGKGCSALIAKTVNAKHPGLATFKVVEGTDHNFAPMEDAEESFLAGFTGEFNPAVIQQIEAWIAERGTTKNGSAPRS